MSLYAVTLTDGNVLYEREASAGAALRASLAVIREAGSTARPIDVQHVEEPQLFESLGEAFATDQGAMIS